MRYEGPIYRPPSEAGSLIIQATVGCPHNKCTFCMVYKKGPPYRARPAAQIREDLESAVMECGAGVRTIFFPAGNTVAMPTEDLAEICAAARELFPGLERTTVYGSSRFICRKGPDDLVRLGEAGLSRIHVGLESGDDEVLRRIKKGTSAEEQIRAGRWTLEAGIELSEYVILGIGGRDRTREHALETARVLNAIDPHFIRLRTFLPKINTLLLYQIRKGRFDVLSVHEVLREARLLIETLEVASRITSDHYTNYIDLDGRLPGDRDKLLRQIDEALGRSENSFRSVYVGDM